MGRIGNGAEGARTPDLLAASQTLSQLSYGPKELGQSSGGLARYSDECVGGRWDPQASSITRADRAVRTRALRRRGDGATGWDDAEGGVGVREPRRPLAPTLAGGAALELPTDDSDDPL